MARTEISGPGVEVQRIEPRLGRTLRRLGGHEPTQRTLVAIEDGSAAISGGGAEYLLGGPAIAWLGSASGARLAVPAGTSGYVAQIDEDALVRALADLDDASPLHAVLAGSFSAELAGSPGAAANVLSSLAAIAAEAASPGRGGAVLVGAHLRIVLVALLRLAGPEGAEPAGSGSNARFLRHFRLLVEANFRAHWPVARYAQTIGIPYDRLHGICRRTLDKTPKALLNERLAREAGLGLERSTLSIEQLSHALGFRDPAHFSHFFKRMTGLSPGAFRRIMGRAGTGRSAASPANFADWP